MKKLFLSILVICSLLGGNAYAEIYKCKLHDNHTFIIKTKNSSVIFEEQALATLDIETGKYTSESMVYTYGVTQGEIIEFKGKEASDHKVIVLKNPDKKSNASFRGLYFDTAGTTYFTSIRIDYWDKDHPIYFYDDWNNRIRKGTCE